MAKSDVRVGFLGAGPWGRNLVRAFQAVPGATVAAVCDTDSARLAVFGSGCPSLRITQSPESLIGSSDLEAIVIATPAETHAALALRSLEAGHHVFVEKPMALSSADAALLCARAEQRSRRLMVGHVLHYHPAVQALLTLVRNGVLGEIRGVHSRRLVTSRRLRDEGAWWSLAPHDVSLMRRLLNDDPHRISVTAHPSATASERVEAKLSFADDRGCTIRVGLGEARDVRRVLVLGTRRSALFDDRAIGSKLMLSEASSRPLPSDELFDDAARGSLAVPIPAVEPLIAEADSFVDAIRTGAPLPSDGIEGHAVTSILEVGAASLASRGHTLSLAPRTVAGSTTLDAFEHGAVSLPF